MPLIVSSVLLACTTEKPAPAVSVQTKVEKPDKKTGKGKAEPLAGRFDFTAFLDEYQGSAIIGRPTDTSVTISILLKNGASAYVEYGSSATDYSGKTAGAAAQNGNTAAIVIDGLRPDALYYYRIQYQQSVDRAFAVSQTATFRTQRPTGSSFSFGVQGDSHPERLGIMYNPQLYTLTLKAAAAAQLDLYFTMGDDFSIERLIERKTYTSETVDNIYYNQRKFLGILAASVPLFQVNGNHEQAAQYLLDGTDSNPAVLAGRARTSIFLPPAPNGFYSGDRDEIKYVGLPCDYYAWQWGDALFVVLDPYWHSPAAVVPVDNLTGSREGKKRDLWDITLGDTQYQWLKQTLENSQAKYKFVFEHHVLGTGRGGIEMAGSYEWGGKSATGSDEFAQKRPGWDLPIHQLMVKNHVTIFFQGHDHLFAYQTLDGIVYQSVPNPADDTYQAFNRDAYKSGTVLPNSGFLKVDVSPAQVRVTYYRSYLPKDESAQHPNGEAAFTYTVSTH